MALTLGKCLSDGKGFTYLGAFNYLVVIRIQTTKPNCICLENFISGLLLGSYIRNERFSISRRPENVGDSNTTAPTLVPQVVLGVY